MKRIIKFEKEDCNPCVMVSEFLTSRNIAFEAINPFDRPEVAMAHKVRSVPTTILLENDAETMRIIGYQPSELTALIDSL